MGEALEFECRRFGSGASKRQELIRWLKEHNVREVVMESTAQYWKPVWLELEPHLEKLHLAQAHSNRAPKRAQGRFPRCQTAHEAHAVQRTGAQLCAGCRATPVADDDARQTPASARSGTTITKPTGGSVRGSAHQALQRDQRSARREWPWLASSGKSYMTMFATSSKDKRAIQRPRNAAPKKWLRLSANSATP